MAANPAYLQPVDDDVMEGEYIGAADPLQSPLIAWADMPNVASELSREQLVKLGARLVKEYDADKESRADWERIMAAAMDVAKQVRKDKSFPWPKASNVKHPLLAIAAMQFAARAYPEIVQGASVVGGEVVGADPDGMKRARADRVAKFMSYQVLDEIEGWQDDTDSLLHVLPVMGVCWRKTYWNGVGDKPASEFYSPDCVVWNYKTRRGQPPKRLTHVLEHDRNEILERQRGGLWLNVELGLPDGEDYDADDTQATYTFLEMHCWADLDGDGYAEPWIVTVHQATREVVRIAPRFSLDGVHLNDSGEVVRIEPDAYWTKYGFIPPPDGSDYDIGFGILLNPLNESINTLINQLIDAGTLANTGGGFIAKGGRMSGGPLRFRPGEWKPADVAGAVLRDSIVPLPTPEPSKVLFDLLGLLLDAAKQLTTVSDEISGQKSSPNEPATSVMARIEQGMKVFGAIQGRIYRSLSHEFRILFRLNGRHLPEPYYARVLDDGDAMARADFDNSEIDIRPTADPNISSDMQRMARAQAILQTVGQCQGNIPEAGRGVLKAMRVDQADIDKYLPDQPTPREQQLMMQAQQAHQVIQSMQADFQGAEQQLAQAKDDRAMKGAELQLKAREIGIKEAEAQQRMMLAQQPQPEPSAPPVSPIEQGRLELDARKQEQDFDMRILDSLSRIEEMERAEQAQESERMEKEKSGELEKQVQALTQAVQDLAKRMDGSRVKGIKQVRDAKGKLIGGRRVYADGTEEDISIE